VLGIVDALLEEVDPVPGEAVQRLKKRVRRTAIVPLAIAAERGCEILRKSMNGSLQNQE